MVVIHEFGARLLVRPRRLERVRGELDGRGDQLVHRVRDDGPALRYVLELPFGVGFTDDEHAADHRSPPRDFDPIVTTAWQYSHRGARTAGTPTRAPRPSSTRSGGSSARRRSGGPSGPTPSAGASTTRRPRTSSTRCARSGSRSSRSSSARRSTARARSTSASSGPSASATTASSASTTPTRPVDFEPGQKKRKEPKEKDDKRPYETIVVVGRAGNLPLPVDVLLTFENGETYRTTWDGTTKWLRLKTHVRLEARRRSSSIPNGKIVLDRDPFNNVRNVGKVKEPSASAKVRAYAMHLVEILFSSLWSLP